MIWILIIKNNRAVARIYEKGREGKIPPAVARKKDRIQSSLSIQTINPLGRIFPGKSFGDIENLIERVFGGLTIVQEAKNKRKNQEGAQNKKRKTAVEESKFYVIF